MKGSFSWEQLQMPGRRYMFSRWVQRRWLLIAKSRDAKPDAVSSSLEDFTRVFSIWYVSFSTFLCRAIKTSFLGSISCSAYMHGNATLQKWSCVVCGMAKPHTENNELATKYHRKEEMMDLQQHVVFHKGEKLQMVLFTLTRFWHFSPQWQSWVLRHRCAWAAISPESEFPHLSTGFRKKSPCFIQINIQINFKFPMFCGFWDWNEEKQEQALSWVEFLRI